MSGKFFFRARAALTLACFGPVLLRSDSARARTPPAAPAPTAAPVAAPDDFTLRLAKVEADLDAKRQELHVPGAALVIVRDDKIVAIKGLGLRDMERKLPVTPRTLFAIGSSTKAFTAMTVMMSADDGKLALADPPRKYLPYFKLRDPDADARITISDLLCHRSGLERTDLAWYTNKLRPQEVIRVAGEAKPTAKLGEKFQYQNVMFLTAGEIVAAVQKRPWTEVVARRIFAPLGMKDSTLSVAVMQRRSDFARGYAYNAYTKDTRLTPTRDLAVIAPAGAINSNAQDMAQWLRLMLGGGVFEGKRLVSEKNFAELSAKHMDIAGPVGYGYGWFLRDWHGHKVVEHGGNIDGFTAEVALMPDQKLGFVLLTNLNVTPLPPLAVDLVWDDLLGAPAAKTPETETAAPAGDPAREVGVYPLAPNFDLDVALKDGKLTVHPTGQPELPLKNVGGRRYTISAPAPPGIFLTFRPAKDDAKATELLFEQNGASVVAKPKAAVAPFVAPLSVEDLMAKAIEAAGGEANLRKRHSVQTRFTLTMATQGITGEGMGYSRAPNASAQVTTLRAAGKKIATTHTYFDGAQGGIETSFFPAMPRTGEPLDDARLAGDFYRELNWKTGYKTVVIQEIKKIGDEEAYVVVKTPEKGGPIKEAYSTKTFRLLQRESPETQPESGQKTTSTETYSDYRLVEGVWVPFKTVVSQATMGDTVLTTQDVKFNVRIPDAVFQPTPKK